MIKQCNNQIRRALIVIMLLVLILPAFSAAAAEEDARINLESANLSGTMLQLIFYSGDAEAPTLETLQVSIDGTPLTLNSLDTIDYADPGTSYLFLFDTNTAVTERALPDMQDIANGIVEKFGSMDNGLIVPVGGEIDKKAFSDDQDALRDTIESLTRGTEKTDLYTSIADAVKLLENDKTLRPRRCLVVMADGLDNTASGISALEVSTLVSQSHVPVYLVALTYNTKTQERIEAAKDICGIARLSPGGVNILLKNDGVTTQDAVDTILAQRAHTYLAAVKAETLQPEMMSEAAEITLTQTSATETLQTSRNVNLSGLSTTASAPTEESQSTPVVNATPQPLIGSTEEQTSVVIRPSIVLISAIAAAAAVIAAGIVILIARKNRRKNEDGSAIVRFAPVAQPQQSQRIENPLICIVRLGEKEDIVFEGPMKEPIFLGKDKDTPVLSETEKARAKATLVWRDGTVWSMQNGQDVLINGIKARTNACLSIGDVLHISGADYRIFYSAD